MNMTLLLFLIVSLAGIAGCAWFIVATRFKPKVISHRQNSLEKAEGEPLEEIFKIAYDGYEVEDLFNRLRSQFVHTLVAFLLSGITVVLSFFLKDIEQMGFPIPLAVFLSYGCVAFVVLLFGFIRLRHRLYSHDGK